VARHAPHVLSHLLLPWPAAGPGLAGGQSRTGTSASIRATSGWQPCAMRCREDHAMWWESQPPAGAAALPWPSARCRPRIRA